MRKVTLTLLASAALAMPALVPAMAQNNPQNNNPQVQQNSAAQQQQANGNSGQRNQQQAANQAISPRQLGRSGVRQVQQALNKKGFDAGHVDGRYGPDTRTALRDFQKSNGIQSNGQLNHKTLSDLGVHVASNQSSGSQRGMSPRNNNSDQNRR